MKSKKSSPLTKNGFPLSKTYEPVHHIYIPLRLGLYRPVHCPPVVGLHTLPRTPDPCTPTYMIQPYPWQQPAVDHHVRFLNDPGCRFHLNVSGAGRGKTVHVGAALARTGHKVFVVCPASVVTEWETTLLACGVKPDNLLAVHSYGYFTYRKTLKEKRRSFWFGKWLRKDFIWDLPKGTVVVFDEVHQCNSSDYATRSPMLLKGIGDNPGLQAIGLSATFADSPIQMKAIGYALGLHDWTNFKFWAYRYGVIHGEYGGLYFGETCREKGKAQKPHDDPRPFLIGMMKPVANRVGSVDFPPDFPRQQVQTISVDVKNSPVLDNAYLKVLEQVKASDRPLPITILLRSRQKSEYLKVPFFVEQTADAVKEGRSVVAFFNFQASLQEYADQIQKKFKQPPGIYDGSSDKDRQDFQNNKIRILAVTMSAGGQSINLHDTDGRFPRTALISPSYSARELIQALGRTFRANQKSVSIAKIIFAARTVESQVRQQVEAKVARIELLTDADLLTESEGSCNFVPVPEELLVPSVPESQIVKLTENAIEVQMNLKKSIEPSKKEPQPMDTETNNHADRGHSKHSPSSLKPKAICPGYENDDSGPPHPITLQGTKLHEVLDGAKHPTDEEEDAMLQVCRDVEAAELAELGLDPSVLIEPEVIFLTGTSYQQSGHVDRLLLSSDLTQATIIDWKFGYTKVDPAKVNWQGKGYALGVFEELEEVQTVKVVFVQPRRNYVTSHVFFRKEMPSLAADIQGVIIEAEKPDAEKKFNPDAMNCKYCARNSPGKCPAMDKSVLSHVSNIDATESGGESPFESLDFTQMEDPAMMGKVLDAAGILEEWVKNAKKAVHAWVDFTGKAPVGYTPYTRKGNRTIPDVAMAVEVMPEGVQLNDILDCCTVSVPKLESLFVKNSTSKSARKDFESLLLDQDNLTRGAETTVLRRG